MDLIARRDRIPNSNTRRLLFISVLAHSPLDLPCGSVLRTRLSMAADFRIVNILPLEANGEACRAPLDESYPLQERLISPGARNRSTTQRALVADNSRNRIKSDKLRFHRVINLLTR